MNEPHHGLGRRGALVLLAVVATLAGVGYVSGLVSTPRHEAPRAVAPPPLSSDNVRPPTSYAQLRESPAGRLLGGSSYLKMFAEGLPKMSDPVVQTPEDKALALARRAERRQFDGAPPLIPHATDAQSVTGCPACHDMGGAIGTTRIPVMSHPAWSQCTQCHASIAPSAVATRDEVDRPLGNTFEGLASPLAGERAFSGAPPVVPHRLATRTACAACHGLPGIVGLRTTHPQRANCLQCHAPSVDVEPWPGSPLAAAAAP